MTHVVLSLGSNIDKEKNIRFALNQLRQRFGEINISPVYETTSVGFVGDPFLNVVAGFESNLDFSEVRKTVREIESSAGRVRGKKSFDNRVLDIDVILFGDADFSPEYNVPRDEIYKYAYVLKPLSDLYPDAVHPVLGVTYREMWSMFDVGQQQLEVVVLE